MMIGEKSLASLKGISHSICTPPTIMVEGFNGGGDPLKFNPRP
ncbi:hypothetical protein [Desulfuribacillus stibiiarsenatis]|nr:hypothetical protein [Desulfuribacillus stibiiarsenatis]